MKRKNPSPEDVAFWRYEQIEEALDNDLSREQRGAIVRRISKTRVRWPSGKTKKISRGSLYRWIERYQRGGFDALYPVPRSDRGKYRVKIPQEVISYAINLLIEDPDTPLTFLLAVLQAEFSDQDINIARSTLQRRLKEHPEYKQVKQAKKRKRRQRFVAKAPHDIWHVDAKGPVTIKLLNSDKLTFHVVSILDDSTRDVLASIVTESPNLAAAVKVFRLAALRWGLPNKLYADRASIFDSIPFRMGLAILGVNRINTKAKNPEAHGKIEAFHRTLRLWFFDRLKKQKVVDVTHLSNLLHGVIQGLYRTHKHRGLKMPPKEALGSQVSKRTVPPSRLYEAFCQNKSLKAHPKTGEVVIQKTTYLVPKHLCSMYLTFLLDPPGELPPLVVDPVSNQKFTLRKAAIKPSDLPRDNSPSQQKQPWAPGPLQTIYDNWQGKKRPQAEPGFGLPEIYVLLTKLAGRHVPQSEEEAALVMDFYRIHGPFSRSATEAAFNKIGHQLGPKRPIKNYLDALTQQIFNPTDKLRS